MRYPNEEFENYRKSAGDLENELIDEYRDGGMTRTRARQARIGARHVVHRCSSLLAGGSGRSGRSRRRQPGTVAGRSASGSPSDGSLEPPLLQSLGALGVSTSRASSSCSPTRTRSCGRGSRRRGSRRTERRPGRSSIRQDVKFHDGTPLTADDVVATFKRLLTKDSQALSSYKGVFAGVQERSATMHVAFDLAARTASSRT